MARNNNRVNLGKKIGAALRRQQAVELKIAGASYRTIAQHFGVSATQAFNDVQKAMAETALLTEESVASLRAIENDRIDKLMMPLWKRATNAEHADLKAIHEIANLIKLRIQLNGLAAETEAEEKSRMSLADLFNMPGIDDDITEQD